MRILEYDVLVIGAGLAGERAAIEAAQMGAKACILSIVQPRQSHSNCAQGGCQASLDNMGDESAGDDWEVHFNDTVRGSDWGANQDCVERLVRLAPKIVRELEWWGCPWSRTGEGKIMQRWFGGTKLRRTCYASDYTGHAMLYTTDQKVMELGIDVFWRQQAMSLIRDGNRILGAVSMDLASGELIIFAAKSTILATGGYGRIFRESTNAVINRGDGLILALEAGMELGNMEAVQFHPTGLFPSWILITEGARGDGGHLKNKAGERFMMEYVDPKVAELASRDVVSRAEWNEIRNGKGFEGGYLHLELMHLGEEHIMKNLRDIHDIVRDFAGIDCIREPIPIRPVQHYSMGGVYTDIDCKVQNYDGCYTAGEVGCWDVHGFNRLGGNSVLETVVSGHVAGEAATNYARNTSFTDGDLRHMHDEHKKQTERIETLLKKRDGLNPVDILTKMGDTMTDKVGIFRTGEHLQQAVDELMEYKEQMKDICVCHTTAPGKSLELERALRAPGMVEIALCIAHGANQRTESRGAHYREDYPNRDDENWLSRTLAKMTDSLPELRYGEVTITHSPPGDRGYGKGKSYS